MVWTSTSASPPSLASCTCAVHLQRLHRLLVGGTAEAGVVVFGARHAAALHQVGDSGRNSPGRTRPAPASRRRRAACAGSRASSAFKVETDAAQSWRSRRPARSGTGVGSSRSSTSPFLTCWPSCTGTCATMPETSVDDAPPSPRAHRRRRSRRSARRSASNSPAPTTTTTMPPSIRIGRKGAAADPAADSAPMMRIADAGGAGRRGGLRTSDGLPRSHEGGGQRGCECGGHGDTRLMRQRSHARLLGQSGFHP